MTEIALLLMFAMGIWGLKVAENRGYNRFLGFALGAALGIIGVLICYFLPRRNNG